MGVDCGDQQLRSKLSYADDIRSYAWSRKWGMYAVQQIRHNAFKCWVDLHNIETGVDPACKMWSDDGVASGKIAWAFQIGLVKGLLAHIRQYKRARSDRDKRKFVDDIITDTHTIINRGDDYRNMRCAVCLHLKSLVPRSKEKRR